MHSRGDLLDLSNTPVQTTAMALYVLRTILANPVRNESPNLRNHVSHIRGCELPDFTVRSTIANSS